MAHWPEATTQRARALGRIFAGTTLLTYGLIVLGALVRAHGAGLACPDWPLCFGEVVPRFDLKVAFEYSHRVAAGSISLLFAGTSLVALRDAAIRPRVRTWIALGAGVLVLQIVLGALTVWHLLAFWTVTAHLLTGNAFALCLAFTARRLLQPSSSSSSSSWLQSTGTPPALRVALTLAGCLLLVQMTLGGLVSSTYAGLACSEWPACNGGVFFPGFEGALGTHLLHRLCAYALAIAIGVCAWLGRSTPGLRALVGAALVLVVAQIGVGVANVLLRLPVEVTGLHSALAAALVLTVALSLATAFERSRGAPAGSAC